jgi:hypothetical protein
MDRLLPVVTLSRRSRQEGEQMMLRMGGFLAAAFVFGAVAISGAFGRSAVVPTEKGSGSQPVAVAAPFAAKVSAICESFAAALHRESKVPPAVRKAERAIPNTATLKQYQTFADYSMVHWMSHFEGSLLRLTALGEPSAGVEEWDRFLSDYRDEVVYNVESVARWQVGALLTDRANRAAGAALNRLAVSAKPAGAERCYRAVTG